MAPGTGTPTPGRGTDSEAWTYCFSFSEELLQEWDWPERYPTQADVERYLQHVADRFDLRRDIAFDTRVVTAWYDEPANRWVILTDRGQELTCRYFIAASGPLSRPLDPPFAGLDSFKGEWHLTARWPGEVDVSGKRVGVIGTGATGVQLIPVIAEAAAHVTVFQRTPNFVIPARNRSLTAEDQQAIKARYDQIWALTQLHTSGFAIAESDRLFGEMSPDEREATLEEAWARGGFHFQFGTFRDLMVDQGANDAAADFIRRKIHSTVADPVTAELLCPRGYPFGAKRPPLGHSYYEAYNRANVSLVDVRRDPIEGIAPDGVRTSSQQVHPCDLLIFATGFDGSTGSFMAMDIRGRGAVPLSAKWSAGPRTFLGLQVDGFPNMFMIVGPQSPFGNVPVMVENEVCWIGDAIAHALSNDVDCLEPASAVVQGWVDEVDRTFERSLVGRAGDTTSWMLGTNVEGKPSTPLFYFGRANRYFDRLRDVARGGFVELCGTPGAP